MRAGAIDIAVHNLKEMPAEILAWLIIGVMTAGLHTGEAYDSNQYAAV